MALAIKNIIEERFRLVVFFCSALVLAYAWFNRFILDDAYISFKYSYNLAHGYGMVWNPGEYVEGYTNFLWTLLMSIPIHYGYSPENFSLIAGLLFFAATLIYFYRTSLIILDSKYLALAALVLCGLNYSFSSFATSGLETSLQTALFISIFYYTLSEYSGVGIERNNIIKLSLLYTAALLTRPDSVIFIGVSIFAVCNKIFNKYTKINKRKKIALIALLLFPAFFVALGWLAWKLSYYGDIIPNTYYAKATSLFAKLRGVYYILAFFVIYLLFPLFFGLKKALLTSSGEIKKNMKLLWHFIALWFLYIVFVAGDFMEFRFIVPAMPLIYILAVWIIVKISKKSIIRYSIAGTLLAASFLHPLITRIPGMVTIPILKSQMENNEYAWPFIGKKLNEYFGNEGEVIIATSAAGAIPYYSGLKTVDMLGLCDSEIPKNGEPVPNGAKGVLKNLANPAHRQKASLDYLVKRNVNLVFNNPWVKQSSDVRLEEFSPEDYSSWASPRYSVNIPSFDELPDGAAVLEILLSDKYYLTALYLIRSDYIDSVAAINKFRVLKIKRGGL